MKHFLTVFAFTILVFVPSALAQEQANGQFSLELNAVEQTKDRCRISFLAFNGLGAKLDRTALEVALFDGEGAIDRLVTLDFENMADGKTKILQFELSQLQCNELSRVLINDVAACEGAEIAPELCLSRLETTSRLAIKFGV